jgi:hypothetical protein
VGVRYPVIKSGWGEVKEKITSIFLTSFPFSRWLTPLLCGLPQEEEEDVKNIHK